MGAEGVLEEKGDDEMSVCGLFGVTGCTGPAILDLMLMRCCEQART